MKYFNVVFWVALFGIIFYFAIDSRDLKTGIENFNKDYGKITTICSGGDSNLIYKNLKNNILLETDLVLKGLYVLLSLNKLI